MKKSIAALAFIISSSLMACPNLEGTFLCTDSQLGKTERVTIEQEGSVYTQRTTAGEFEINADGSGRNFEIELGQGLKLNGVMIASCSGEQLLIDINGRGSYQGAEFPFTEKSETFINSAGHLAQHVKGSSAGRDFEVNTVCTRE